MPRYVALLRGVSPMNASMPELKRCLESAGFGNVRTLLSSGNVAFDAPGRSETLLAGKVEAAMQEQWGRSFWTVVRSTRYLQELIQSDPFADYPLPAAGKRVVTFLREPQPAPPDLPIEREGARILSMQDLEVFSDYLPRPRGPIFMTLIEKTLGSNITTRTWDTVRKCAVA
jgi:uncharacterized protein (DUF1697 family)